MKIQFLICFWFALGLAMVKADDNSEANPESVETVPSNVEKPKVNAEKYLAEADESTSLVEEDPAHKGFCHWGIKVYFKPGYQIRCSCLRCVCAVGGNWKCAYHFPYCPYYYCGGKIYNPFTQVCCCGKIYTKNNIFRCCGYFYYNVRINKCCRYDTVKPRRANCPRFQIQG